eukprot:29542-Prorocentrum_minimum.AAC.1
MSNATDSNGPRGEELQGGLFVECEPAWGSPAGGTGGNGLAWVAGAGAQGGSGAAAVPYMDGRRAGGIARHLPRALRHARTVPGAGRA